MPVFEIEDEETGIKVLAEGAEEPDQNDASELVGEEIEFLKDNLYNVEGNKWIMDVGPSYGRRKIVDDHDKAFGGSVKSKIEASKKKTEDVNIASERTGRILKDLFEKGFKPASVQKEFDRIYETELGKVKTERPDLVEEKQKTTKELTFEKIPENSFMLVSHGSEKGGLYTELGQKFTLNNVAKLLGEHSNTIHNVINLSCYGGKQCAQDYQSAFPNVTNIAGADQSKINSISIDALSKGEFFDTNMAPLIWEKKGGNWSIPASSSLFTNIGGSKPVTKQDTKTSEIR